MDQDVVMDEISNKIKNAGINMRKALETADLKKGLKFANALLMELKTGAVTPRNYYNLCITLNRHAGIQRTQTTRAGIHRGAKKGKEDWRFI